MIPRRWVYILPAEYKQVLNPPEALLTNELLIAKWEEDFANLLGSKNGVSVSSGRVGLKLILQHLKIQNGDEIIIPALTLKALVNIIESLGAKPVCADIDPKTLNITPETVSKQITKRTKAIIALHTFGNPCLIKEICEIADHHNIPVIEDCAHACGAKVKDKFVGTFGYAGFFSFDISKPINTYGGGMVVSQDETLINYIRNYNLQLKQDLKEIKKKAKSIQFEQTLYNSKLMYLILFFRTQRFFFKIIEFIYRKFQSVPPENIIYNPLQSAIGIEKLPSLISRIEHRNETAQLYRKLLSDKIHIPYVDSDNTPSYYMFTIILPINARKACRSLLFRGIDTAFEEEVIDNVAPLIDSSSCPNANSVYPYLLALPFYDGISEETVEYICTCLNSLVS
ncbi:MAG TPA: aminotransferase class I/II-fold pyridoxal phosphate-dependent enzyme [Candidatus Hydrogenedens sp.]|nr:aminotransferase class I/II-fold pyridoxal phosphate-dependent enzyme [Candidatus Hydrogenedens sp.]HPP57541.1 aminotransferase class I/II-fold pyridoxal phosphate-dependent enzyme [Candidatus Hydrogenedens sp.]